MIFPIVITVIALLVLAFLLLRGAFRAILRNIAFFAIALGGLYWARESVGGPGDATSNDWIPLSLAVLIGALIFNWALNRWDRRQEAADEIEAAARRQAAIDTRAEQIRRGQ